jgi:hypothetical protein
MHALPLEFLAHGKTPLVHQGSVEPEKIPDDRQIHHKYLQDSHSRCSYIYATSNPNPVSAQNLQYDVE